MTALPNVLLLGDSIRMSYQPHVAAILEDPHIAKRGQNNFSDAWFLMRRYGIRLAGGFFDTMIAQKILFPDYFVRLVKSLLYFINDTSSTTV